MNFQVDVSSAFSMPSAERPASSALSSEVTDLLKQILETQREQLHFARQAAAQADHMARWRAYLARWQQEFPGLSEGCRASIPKLERAYGQMIADLAEKLSEDDIDSEFALQEFLDRYGIRLAQLGTLINLVGPLAEASPPQES